MTKFEKLKRLAEAGDNAAAQMFTRMTNELEQFMAQAEARITASMRTSQNKMIAIMQLPDFATDRTGVHIGAAYGVLDEMSATLGLEHDEEVEADVEVGDV